VKKLIFSLFVLLVVALLASCGLNPAPEGESESLNVNGGSGHEFPRYITMRLADYGEYESDSIGINTGGSRTLTRDNAEASHDFFEAVFMYGNPGNYTIARVTWTIGETPELRGVHRTTGGINYGFVTGEGRLNGEGAAVLFVGAKADKTLLALGRLVMVDGVEGTTTIYEKTKSVTFEVAALKAGVRFYGDRANSSFWTNYLRGSNSGTESNIDAANTLIENDIYIHYVGKKPFPLFKLNNTYDTTNGGGNSVTWGYYNFAVETGDDYAAGIVLAGERNWETREPRYKIVDGLYQYSSFLQQDMKTTVQLEGSNNVRFGENFGSPSVPYNPVTAPAYFGNPVRFRFDTSALRVDLTDEDGSVFALAFEIFVNNLTARPTTLLDSPDPGPVKWRISTGLGQKWLDLDDGDYGEGGAIFLGTGNVSKWLLDP
jgi:hypothetical protein